LWEKLKGPRHAEIEELRGEIKRLKSETSDSIVWDVKLSEEALSALKEGLSDQDEGSEQKEKDRIIERAVDYWKTRYDYYKQLTTLIAASIAAVVAVMSAFSENIQALFTAEAPRPLVSEFIEDPARGVLFEQIVFIVLAAMSLYLFVSAFIVAYQRLQMANDNILTLPKPPPDLWTLEEIEQGYREPFSEERYAEAFREDFSFWLVALLHPWSLYIYGLGLVLSLILFLLTAPLGR